MLADHIFLFWGVQAQKCHEDFYIAGQYSKEIFVYGPYGGTGCGHNCLDTNLL